MRDLGIGIVVLLVLSTGGVAIPTIGSAPQDGGNLQVLWTNEPQPSQALQYNHHTPAAVHFRGESYIAVPRNSQHGTFCGLTLLNGSGDVRWRDTIPDEQCTVHAVSDPTIADFDSDGWPEVWMKSQLGASVVEVRRFVAHCRLNSILSTEIDWFTYYP